MDLERAYAETCRQQSDINEQLPLLHQYALSCQHITEFGVRLGVSTTCFLHARPRVLVSYDVEKKPDTISHLCGLADAAGVEFSFRKIDVRTTRIEPTELLFIDTWHVYEQLRVELLVHAEMVSRFIALHDTVTFGDVGESPGHGGLWQAIIEFLYREPEWTVVEHRSNNNGLTILGRRRQWNTKLALENQAKELDPLCSQKP